jgi:hypothetical protein
LKKEDIGKLREKIEKKNSHSARYQLYLMRNSVWQQSALLPRAQMAIKLVKHHQLSSIEQSQINHIKHQEH